MLRVNYSAMPVSHGLANISRSKRWIFTKLSEVIFLIILLVMLGFINKSMFLGLDESLLKSPEAWLNSACDITG